ncbi:hypothetical protein [Vibrio cholerae]|uniref:hypothetical protein n=1 Tax=Vibrio cholerae TaxID=666 RepID=UPI0002C179E4|nr:hypothetical protein [Vibrio cholerae]EMQ55818.1 hypothetical protein VCEM1676A_000454 [Vibrio cholerae O1 str. EM-1676A]
MINFKPSSHIALLYSFVVGLIFAFIAHFLNGSFELDLTTLTRVGVVGLSSILVGVFVKKIYDNYEKIVNYEFPESAPLKIKESIREQIENFKNNVFINYQTKSYLIIYASLFVCAVFFKPKTQSIFIVGLAQITVVMFVSFSFFLSVFLFRLNSFMNDKINYLNRRSEIEKARQDLIGSIQKTKKEFQKNNDMQRKHREIDVKDLIDKLKSDSKSD